jgi:two-component system chemotaxis response regulator CheY
MTIPSVSLGIADDEPDILGLFGIMLGRGGYRIAYMARNGEEAVERQRQTPADIVIMDYSMPYMDGIEATRKILGEFPGTHVLLLTCGEEILDKLNGLNGVTIVKKPFKFKHILSLLEKVRSQGPPFTGQKPNGAGSR